MDERGREGGRGTDMAERERERRSREGEERRRVSGGETETWHGRGVEAVPS